MKWLGREGATSWWCQLLLLGQTYRGSAVYGPHSTARKGLGLWGGGIFFFETHDAPLTHTPRGGGMRDPVLFSLCGRVPSFSPAGLLHCVFSRGPPMMGGGHVTGVVVRKGPTSYFPPPPEEHGLPRLGVGFTSKKRGVGVKGRKGFFFCVVALSPPPWGLLSGNSQTQRDTEGREGTHSSKSWSSVERLLQAQEGVGKQTQGRRRITKKQKKKTKNKGKEEGVGGWGGGGGRKGFFTC